MDSWARAYIFLHVRFWIASWPGVGGRRGLIAISGWVGCRSRHFSGIGQIHFQECRLCAKNGYWILAGSRPSEHAEHTKKHA